MKKKTRILIADDHAIILRGLRPLLESEWGWEICGEACDGDEALALALELKPDVVVLDVLMPKINGVDLTRMIKQALPDTEILAFTGADSEDLVRQLFAAGALGYVLKSDAITQLIPAIRAVCQHQPYLGVAVSRIIFETYIKGGIGAAQTSRGELSPREREVLQLIAGGKSNKAAATALGTSVKTVETQRATIMRKLGFTTFSELMRYAVRNHIVPP